MRSKKSNITPLVSIILEAKLHGSWNRKKRLTQETNRTVQN